MSSSLALTVLNNKRAHTLYIYKEICLKFHISNLTFQPSSLIYVDKTLGIIDIWNNHGKKKMLFRKCARLYQSYFVTFMEEKLIYVYQIVHILNFEIVYIYMNNMFMNPRLATFALLILFWFSIFC